MFITHYSHHISELFSKLYGLVHKNNKHIFKCNGAYFATDFFRVRMLAMQYPCNGSEQCQ